MPKTNDPDDNKLIRVLWRYVPVARRNLGWKFDQEIRALVLTA